MSVHCPYHTDVSLVTIIPQAKSTSQGGLHVWHYGLSKWLDIEAAGAPPNVAVVLAGETLSYLTNNFILGGLHDVSQLSGDRFSCPFQGLASAESLLDPRQFQWAPDAAPGKPMQARAFVHEISSKRTSSNFPRDVVFEKLSKLK